jgi:hypothetical protein
LLTSDQKRRSLLERLYHVHLALEELSTHRESLSGGASALLEATDRLLNEVLRQFHTQWSYLEEAAAGKPDTERSEEERAVLCDEFADTATALASAVVPILEGAEPENVPVEIEPILQAMMRKAASSWNLSACVLSSSFSYNYSIGVCHFADFYSLIKAPQLAPKKDFVVVQIPRLESQSLPLHAILIGHEMGHLFEMHAQISDKLSLPIPPKLGIPLPEPGAAQRRDTFVSHRASWIREILADIFSVLLIGPAAPLSIAELAGTVQPLDEDQFTHPSPIRRLSVMVDLLRKGGFFGVDGVERILGETSALKIVKPPPPVMGEPKSWNDYIWSEIVSILDGLVAECVDVVGASAFTAADWTSVKEVVDALEHGLPCGEGTAEGGSPYPISPAAILNAAWTVKCNGCVGIIDELQLDPNATGSLLRSNYILDELVLKSLEISAIRSR